MSNEVCNVYKNTNGSVETGDLVVLLNAVAGTQGRCESIVESS